MYQYPSPRRTDRMCEAGSSIAASLARLIIWQTVSGMYSAINDLHATYTSGSACQRGPSGWGQTDERHASLLKKFAPPLQRQPHALQWPRSSWSQSVQIAKRAAISASVADGPPWRAVSAMIPRAPSIR